MNKENIRSRIDADADALIATIRELVAVPSVGGPAEPGAPFGPGPKAALDKKHHQRYKKFGEFGAESAEQSVAAGGPARRLARF